jgi:very-short-patch-repair endonuclease
VDFVIGERLVIEVDGAEYHTDPVRFEADRRRDALLSARGYRVLRFSYRLVIDDWPTVETAVLAAVARGDHL